MGENLGTLKEKLCCEGVVSPEENETFNPNQGKSLDLEKSYLMMLLKSIKIKSKDE
jgi:hypothetical protein